MTHPTLIIQCPTCQKSLSWNAESLYKPFCSDRCRLIDLGAWAGEDHRIPCEEHEIPDTADLTNATES